jgi:SAM-dependent methyltransferase
MTDVPEDQPGEEPRHGGDKPWHPYVYDPAARAYIGDFEGLYRAEAEGRWDAWNQSDPRNLDSRIAALLLDQVTFASVLDLGCGTGSFTATLKRRDTRVMGLDVSETAIATARARFPDVEWAVGAAADYLEQTEPVDLIVIRQLLSYLESWRRVLARCAELCRYSLVSLYLPPDPIGFVKTHEELEGELARHFLGLETVRLANRSLSVYLLASRR